MFVCGIGSNTQISGRVCAIDTKLHIVHIPGINGDIGIDVVGIVYHNRRQVNRRLAYRPQTVEGRVGPLHQPVGIDPVGTDKRIVKNGLRQHKFISLLHHFYIPVLYGI
ncbi:hypothetical protein SDC9_174344 [bioreactor metagenome]|uniref:Uncharacterized protein n=1 Tax=bioreactor metagenome TaxID=1076179 RepID=A0A645GJ05_9ZZZZ